MIGGKKNQYDQDFKETRYKSNHPDLLLVRERKE